MQCHASAVLQYHECALVRSFMYSSWCFRYASVNSSFWRFVPLGGVDLSEPTTDKFTVVMHGAEDLSVEGNSLAVIKELPYEGLTRFGTG